MAVDAVVFDVGETLVDETRGKYSVIPWSAGKLVQVSGRVGCMIPRVDRILTTREYETWADWLGVPRHTFSAVFGAVIALGMDYRDTFQYFHPGFSLDAERARRADSGRPEWFGEDDLYPDVRPCMAALRDMGVWVGVAGNQTSHAGEILRKLGLPADLIATSEDWGVSKPDQSFFRALISAAPCEAERIVYVGDRLDNDLKPAKAAGMRAAFIRRGPWGYIWENHPDMAAAADWRLASLAELPSLVAGVNRSER